MTQHGDHDPKDCRHCGQREEDHGFHGRCWGTTTGATYTPIGGCERVLDADVTMTRNVVYIAGPYMGANSHDASSYLQIDEHIADARFTMAELVKRGYGVFCPHTHSAHFEVILPHIPAQFWYELDLHFLRSCDAVLRLPGYSKGADAEVAEAERLGLPIYVTLAQLVKDLPTHKEAAPR